VEKNEINRAGLVCGSFVTLRLVVMCLTCLRIVIIANGLTLFEFRRQYQSLMLPTDAKQGPKTAAQQQRNTTQCRYMIIAVVKHRARAGGIA
jgi:hypothetical protein